MGLAVDGLASGLDTTNIISKLLEIEKRPVAQLERKQVAQNQKLTAWTELENKLISFQSVTESISSVSTFSGLSASFTNSSSTATQTVLTAEASSSATSASYTIDITSMATPEKEISQGVVSTTDAIAGTGTIDITVGGNTVSVSISSANNTLEGIKKAINNAGAGVTASILNDGSSQNPYRLHISGNSSGSKNTISITDNLDPGGFINAPGGNLFTFTEAQSASDAKLTLDGIAITKSSNVITDAIEGVTINIKNTGTGKISIESDLTGVEENISSFVKAFNEINGFIREQSTLDSNSGDTGTLFGSTTLLSIERKIRGVVTGSVPGLNDTFTYLSQVGVRTNSEGNLDINSSELSDALREDFQSVVNLFILKGETSSGDIQYLSKTSDTKGGVYELQVESGAPQIRKQGDTVWTAMTGSGSFWTAASGDANGLQLQFSDMSEGSHGTINLSTGVADLLSTEVNFLTDKTYKGMLFSEEELAKKNILDFQDQIDGLNFRIQTKEVTLRNQFTSLEATMGALNSQRDFLTSALASLGKK